MFGVAFQLNRPVGFDKLQGLRGRDGQGRRYNGTSARKETATRIIFRLMADYFHDQEGMIPKPQHGTNSKRDALIISGNFQRVETMTGSLTGKVAVITGAARGLGREYAIKMAAEGAAIVAGDVRSCDETVAAISKDGGQATGVELDVADPASCDNATKIAADLYGNIDVLVNNAAIYGGLKGGPFDAIEIEEWDRCMAVNVTGI